MAPVESLDAAAARSQRLRRPVKARPMLNINRPASLNGALKISVSLTVAPQSRGPSYAALAAARTANRASRAPSTCRAESTKSSSQSNPRTRAVIRRSV